MKTKSEDLSIYMPENTVEKLLFVFLAALMVVAIGALGFVTWKAADRYFYPPTTITLVKSEWKCTATDSRWLGPVLVRKIVMPGQWQTYCVKYEKK